MVWYIVWYGYGKGKVKLSEVRLSEVRLSEVRLR